MKKIIITVIAVSVAAFLWWTVSPLFIDKEVHDDLDPELEALLTQSNTESLPLDQNALEDSTDGVPILESSEDAHAATSEVRELPVVLTENDSTISAPAETSSPTEPPSPTVRGPFVIEDTSGHPATGNVRVIDAIDERIVRFENYVGTNGPDLYVYLAKDLDANEFVSLGRAKGNKGNINYTVPADVDIDEYPYVLTWCRAFGVLFDYATIN